MINSQDIGKSSFGVYTARELQKASYRKQGIYTVQIKPGAGNKTDESDGN